jgi:hypothetical protein
MPKFFRKYADLITEAETQQLDEGIVDSLKAAMAKLKAVPGIQKYMQAAETKKAQLIQAAQNSSNGKELLANIKQAMGGQQAVAEGIKVGGVSTLLLAMAARVFMDSYLASGKPNLSALTPASGGEVALGLVGFLVLLGACFLAAGFGRK